MRLVDNKVDSYTQESGIDGVYKAVRDAASICYQTDISKMKKTPKEFVNDVLLKNGHTRPLEFGTIYLRIVISPIASSEINNRKVDIVNFYTRNKYSEVVMRERSNEYDCDEYYITTNLRVIMQGSYESDQVAHANGYDKNFLSDLKYICDEPCPEHKKRYTYSMWISRGCSDDNRTHITLSSICESTRFCNYGNNKFNNELTFIRPYWIDYETVDYYNNGKCVEFYSKYKDNKDKVAQIEFLQSMERDENNYIEMSKLGLQPQQLKRIFPLGVKAELRLCGFLDAWTNFIWRRSDIHADPECELVSNMIKNDMIDNNILSLNF